MLHPVVTRALVAASALLAIVASCYQPPKDEPEVPCCVQGFMASCHGRDEHGERFVMCSGGRCVVGDAGCPAEVEAPPDAAPPPPHKPALDAGPTESDAGPVDAKDPNAWSDAKCEREIARIEPLFEAARRCKTSEDCTKVGYACFGSCGRAISKPGIEQLRDALETFQSHCVSQCPVPKCAPWVTNAPMCRKGRCEIPETR